MNTLKLIESIVTIVGVAILLAFFCIMVYRLSENMRISTEAAKEEIKLKQRELDHKIDRERAESVDRKRQHTDISALIGTILEAIQFKGGNEE